MPENRKQANTRTLHGGVNGCPTKNSSTPAPASHKTRFPNPVLHALATSPPSILVPKHPLTKYETWGFPPRWYPTVQKPQSPGAKTLSTAVQPVASASLPLPGIYPPPEVAKRAHGASPGARARTRTRARPSHTQRYAANSKSQGRYPGTDPIHPHTHIPPSYDPPRRIIPRRRPPRRPREPHPTPLPLSLHLRAIRLPQHKHGLLPLPV